ncbi:MAG: hypothetical protein JWP74_556 [Marmoricola sp.]|nr:hypothetical protein [Marmoricola sp.]
MTFWGWVRRVGLTVLAVALVEYLAVPQLVEARSELRLFADAKVWLLLGALVFEAASLLSYTALTRAVLAPEVRPSFSVQLRIDLTGLGASHLLPGGTASASALRYRLMTARGVPGTDALSTAAVETVVGFIGLVATFTGGVVLASPGVWSHPGYVLAGLAGAAVLAAAYAAVATGRLSPRSWPAHRDRRVRETRAGRWFAAQSARAVVTSRRVAERADTLLRTRRQRRRLLGWAAGNWLFDAVSLWLCLAAYGVDVRPGALLVAYGAANLAGLLPFTPGGLGIVEGVLIPALAVLSGAAGPVVLGVLTWRALEFWLPIPVSGLAYLSLRPWSTRRLRQASAHSAR